MEILGHSQFFFGNSKKKWKLWEFLAIQKSIKILQLCKMWFVEFCHFQKIQILRHFSNFIGFRKFSNFCFEFFTILSINYTLTILFRIMIFYGSLSRNKLLYLLCFFCKNSVKISKSDYSAGIFSIFYSVLLNV